MSEERGECIICQDPSLIQEAIVDLKIVVTKLNENIDWIKKIAKWVLYVGVPAALTACGSVVTAAYVIGGKING